MCPVGAPMSATIAAARSMTRTYWGWDWRATRTAPSGKPAMSSGPNDRKTRPLAQPVDADTPDSSRACPSTSAGASSLSVHRELACSGLACSRTRRPEPIQRPLDLLRHAVVGSPPTATRRASSSTWPSVRQSAGLSSAGTGRPPRLPRDNASTLVSLEPALREMTEFRSPLATVQASGLTDPSTVPMPRPHAPLMTMRLDVGPVRVHRTRHTAGDGIDHGQAGDSHRNVFVGNALDGAVADGPGGVQARDDLLVRGEDLAPPGRSGRSRTARRTTTRRPRRRRSTAARPAAPSPTKRTAAA